MAAYEAALTVDFDFGRLVPALRRALMFAYRPRAFFFAMFSSSRSCRCTSTSHVKAAAGCWGSLPPTGETGKAMFRAGVWGMTQAGYASEHDALIAEHLANTLCGGNRIQGTAMTEQDVLDLECEAFVSLCGTEKTQARIQSILATGKPLRN